MNKTGLIEDISQRCDISKSVAENCCNAVFDSIAGALAQGDKVQIVGFGTFEAKEMAARTGRNPNTGEQISIKKKRVPKFKAGKTFKDAVV